MLSDEPSPSLDRRQWLAAATAAGLALAASPRQASSAQSPHNATQPAVRRLRYALNMSTIRGQKLMPPQQADLAAKAGYDAIEPWIPELRQYQDTGGSLDDLRKRIADKGLAVASAIGFAEWIVDDDERRAKGLEQAKRDMELIRSIGGTHIAAPPAGARTESIDLSAAAERYRAVLEVGASVGVVPQLEVWGFSASISKLGQAAFIASECRHPDACLLLDVYHLYKGGSEFAGLRLLSGAAMHCFHMNDYPAEPPRDKISDADRVYPGDGVAPLNDVLIALLSTGFAGTLSLELFNPQYWKQDPLDVARTGLEKMKRAVARVET